MAATAAPGPAEVPPPPSPAAPEGGDMTREAMEQQPFVDRHWLYYNGLRRENVLEYFAQSRFYDRASCNEELRMQGAGDIRAEHLKGMTGVQYLAEEVPSPTREPIFVIQKLLRSSLDQEPQVLEVYYILNGMIYQAPTIYSVLNARLRRCAHLLNKAQRTLSQAVGFEYHQQAGAAAHAAAYHHHAAAAAAGGSADLYTLKRGRGGGRGRGRGGKRGKQQQAPHPGHHHYPYPMMMPPPHPMGPPGYEAYYPSLRGEDVMMVDVDGQPGQVPPPPLPSPHGAHGMVPPPPPAGGEENGLPARLISRYPGPSPLTDAMTAAHPEAPAAVEKVVSGVVDEFRPNGGSTSSASTAATAGMGPEGATAAASAGGSGSVAPEVTNKEEI